MALLLDTHVFYWVVVGSDRLPPRHRDLLAIEPGNVYVSAATAWKLSTKVRLGKWPEAAPLIPGLEKIIADAGLSPLPLSATQAEIAGSFDHRHKDPFDRMLAAQAIDLDLTLLTVDKDIADFGCKVI